jgi:hypothetical protein
VHSLHRTYIGIEIILDALDRLLGDEAHVEAQFHPFGDSATLGARLVHDLCRTYRRLRNSIGGTPIELLGDVGHVESRFDLF